MKKRYQYVLNGAIGTSACALVVLVLVRIFHIENWAYVGALLFAAKVVGGGLGLVYTWAWHLGMPTEEEVERALANLEDPLASVEMILWEIEDVRSRQGDERPYWQADPHQVRWHLSRLAKRGRVVRDSRDPRLFALKERTA